MKECSWEWIDTHSVGGGFPDGLAVRLTLTGWQVVLMEIKNPKSHAHGKNGDPFTDDEHKFYVKYPGLVSVVNGREDVLNLLDRKVDIC